MGKLTPEFKRRYKKHRELNEKRGQMVIKHNELVQKSRFNLTVIEQRIVLYLISKLQPKDIDFKEHEFEIKDFCEVCGMDEVNGMNYKIIKDALKALRDKSIWVKQEDGGETTLAWFDYVTMYEDSGKVYIKLYERMKPYLLQLRQFYTQYELIYTLAMKSKYSVRMYELLKSHQNQGSVTVDLERLKEQLFATSYAKINDFKRKVLDIAMREINQLTDINAEYEFMNSEI